MGHYYIRSPSINHHFAIQSGDGGVCNKSGTVAWRSWYVSLVMTVRAAKVTVIELTIDRLLFIIVFARLM